MHRIGSLVACVAILAGIPACVGCGSRPAAAPPLTIEDLPPAFLATAKQRFPRVRFDAVFRKPDGTLEIRGREKNGKVREVQIRPDGTVVELE